MSETLMLIQAPHFAAGLVVVDWRVAEAAPILRYMLGWSRSRVEGYCAGKRWHLSTVRPIK